MIMKATDDNETAIDDNETGCLLINILLKFFTTSLTIYIMMKKIAFLL